LSNIGSNSGSYSITLSGSSRIYPVIALLNLRPLKTIGYNFLRLNPKTCVRTNTSSWTAPTSTRTAAS
jgi:hypothetical protein